MEGHEKKAAAIENPLSPSGQATSKKRRGRNWWPLAVLVFPVLFYGGGALLIFSMKAGPRALGSWSVDLHNSNFAGVFLLVETAVIVVLCFSIPAGGE